MKHIGKLAAVVFVLAALFVSSVFVASAEVSSAEGDLFCDHLTLTGTATSPYVTVYTYNYDTNDYFFIVVPVSGGTFSGTVTFPLAPDGTLFYIEVWGTLNPYTNFGDSGYWDMEDVVEADYVPCVPAVDAACSYPLPADAVVYDVPAGAPTFFDANLDTKLNFDLPAGTWKISEFEGDFAKVWIACEANPVWIPSNAVGAPIG